MSDRVDPEFVDAVVRDLAALRAYTWETRRAFRAVVLLSACVSSLVASAVVVFSNWAARGFQCP